jgi:hypothetical protein
LKVGHFVAKDHFFWGNVDSHFTFVQKYLLYPFFYADFPKVTSCVTSVVLILNRIAISQEALPLADWIGMQESQEWSH